MCRCTGCSQVLRVVVPLVQVLDVRAHELCRWMYPVDCIPIRSRLVPTSVLGAARCLAHHQRWWKDYRERMCALLHTVCLEPAMAGTSGRKCLQCCGPKWDRSGDNPSVGLCIIWLLRLDALCMRNGYGVRVCHIDTLHLSQGAWHQCSRHQQRLVGEVRHLLFTIFSN